MAQTLGEALALIATLDREVAAIAGLSLRVSLLAVAAGCLFGLPLGALVATGSFPGRQVVVALTEEGRALYARAGVLLTELEEAAAIDGLTTYGVFGRIVLPLSKAFGRLQQATAEVARRGMGDPFEAGAAASDYLRLFGLTALAYVWARMAEAALDKAADDPTGFYRGKLGTARFFMERMLPETTLRLARIKAGSETTVSWKGMTVGMPFMMPRRRATSL